MIIFKREYISNVYCGGKIIGSVVVSGRVDVVEAHQKMNNVLENNFVDSSKYGVGDIRRIT